MNRLIVIFGLIFFTAIHVFAQQPALRQKQFNIEKTGLAIKGYDPVAYFSVQKAIEGKREISTVFQGSIYRFSSIENREAFKISPAKYEPQYGGWCAYAMGAKGQKVEVDPETFKILNGKLYLFYNKYLNNTLNSWNKDEGRLKVNADKNWMKYIGQ